MTSEDQLGTCGDQSALCFPSQLPCRMARYSSTLACVIDYFLINESLVGVSLNVSSVGEGICLVLFNFLFLAPEGK